MDTENNNSVSQETSNQSASQQHQEPSCENQNDQPRSNNAQPQGASWMPAQPGRIVVNPSLIPEKKTVGLAVAALVLGIVSLVFSGVPLLNFMMIVVAILAIVFGIVSLVKISRDKLRLKGKGLAITGLVTGGLALIVSIIMCIQLVLLGISYYQFKDAYDYDLDGLFEDGSYLNDYHSDYNSLDDSDDWKDDCEITLGDFGVSNIDELSVSSTSMPVIIKNISKTTKSFFVTIEAVDENGDRIAEDYASALKLAPGQSTTVSAFTYVDENKLSQLKTATFKVLEAEDY